MENNAALQYVDKFIKDSRGKWITTPSSVAYKLKVNVPEGYIIVNSVSAIDKKS